LAHLLLPPALAACLAVSSFAFAVTPVRSAATFVVNRTGDAADRNLANAACDTSTATGNQCTLRAAIQEANDTPGADIINFNITSASKVIAPPTQLPPITQQVTINGYSQPNTAVNTQAAGSNAVLRIVLDGVNANASATGLRIQANDVVVRGLVIQRWRGQGILISGNDNAVVGCFIGTNAAGTLARGNTFGVTVTGAGNEIGRPAPDMRNLISGNTDTGLHLTGAAAVNNSVLNSYIGTDADGNAALPNGRYGVGQTGGSGLQVGDGTTQGRNVISGNAHHGVAIGNTGSFVRGNYIGTNAAGMAALGNGGDGVRLEGGGGHMIGGSSASAGNTISDNDDGIQLSESDDNTILRNRIGTKVDGSGDLGNRFLGIWVFGDRTLIGGSGNGNTIANSGQEGIFVGSSADTDVIGNAIVGSGATGINFASGPGSVAGNALIGNALDGIQVAGNVVGIAISANLTINNGGLGIDLVKQGDPASGVTGNDSGDVDMGGNGSQNFPVFTTAQRFSNGATVIAGTLNSTANTAFRIELFIATGAVDPSNHGEAQFLLAFQNVTTNGSGNAGFSFTLGNLPAGQVVAATAQNVGNGNSSEYSANVTVTTGP
jgi:titin